MTASDSTESSDPTVTGTYHFLDVGGLKYGECTLVEFRNTRILIDGAHVNDFGGQRGYPSVPEQLKRILGGEPPYDVTLLVVTHCHADHVGCLLELVGQGLIRPKFALITDPKLGFGRAHDHDARTLDARDPREAMAAALREEDASDLEDADLAEFIDAVASVEQRYGQLVDKLRQNGVRVTPYVGAPLPQDLALAVAPSGLSLLGPSTDQLLRCAEQISTTNSEAEDAVDNTPDAAEDLVGLYRALVGDSGADVQNPRGNGMNCQSITLAFGPPGARVLLAGDMQFSEPGVAGADGEVAKLRQAVIAAGPYKLYKTTHHTSHNGQDAAFLDALGSPPLIVHSGGLRDAKHPFPSVLHMLERRPGIRFARTDRNGLITVQPHKAVAAAISTSRGALNDFSPNSPGDAGGEMGAPLAEPPPPAVARQGAANSGVQIVIVNLPNAPIDMTVAGVEIQIRPRPLLGQSPQLSGTRADLVPIPERIVAQSAPDFSLSRSLAGLLFVTDPDRLRANIGRAEADGALAAIQAAKGVLVTGDSEALADGSANALKADPSLKGVVILGGYDVAPSVRTDAIGPELRQVLGGGQVGADGDRFWVWSDRLYGDTDGDHLAEIPVSRIPDARDSRLFLRALCAKPFQAGERFGIRNVFRPFAEAAWPVALGARAFNVSELFTHSDVQAAHLGAPCHYFMLHGDDLNGREFSGGARGGGYPLAFTTRNVPAQFDGVAFSGCCWGALIVDGRALDAVAVVPPPRTREASIALSYLHAGALAFIGCTGSHYSGEEADPDLNYAARLHAAFFSRLANGAMSPAQALHEAKDEHLAWTLANQPGMDPRDVARRFKNVTQFTCLGLGW